MKLQVTRQQFDGKCTMGLLTIDGVFHSYTLEPPLSGVPHPAIPLGTYNVEITFSPHFNRLMPLVDDVPGRTDIRIHPLNEPAETEGCLGVGETLGADQILQSDVAFEPLLAGITAAKNSGEAVTITYTGEPNESDSILS